MFCIADEVCEPHFKMKTYNSEKTYISSKNVIHLCVRAWGTLTIFVKE